MRGLVRGRLLMVFGITMFGATARAGVPATLQLDGRSLEETRRSAPAWDTSCQDAVRELCREADAFLATNVFTVVDKPEAGPSGDKRDYVSLAPYFWPNPATPNGLPYISKDGVVNREGLVFDRYRIIPMCQSVYICTLAWYFTGDEKYEQRAVRQLRAWFVDEATRMNPNMRYAQLVRGKNEGSSFGIIDSVELIEVLDAVAILEAGGRWPSSDQQKLKAWFKAFLVWLRESAPGKAEARSPQNHGTWYDAATASYALFVGDRQIAKEILRGVVSRRIATQVLPDGSQPLELKRTKALDYSLFNLEALFKLARLGEHTGVDIWDARTSDGRSLRGALDFLIPYATGSQSWQYPQIGPPTFGPLVPLLREAARAYRAPAYGAALEKMADLKKEKDRARLLRPLMSEKRGKT